MTKAEKLRVASVYAAIAKGEADISKGRTISFSENMLTEISATERQNSLKRIDYLTFNLQFLIHEF